MKTTDKIVALLQVSLARQTEALALLQDAGETAGANPVLQRTVGGRVVATLAGYSKGRHASDIIQSLPEDKPDSIRATIWVLVKQGLLKRVRHGVYAATEAGLDRFEIPASARITRSEAEPKITNPEAAAWGDDMRKRRLLAAFARKIKEPLGNDATDEQLNEAEAKISAYAQEIGAPDREDPVIKELEDEFGDLTVDPKLDVDNAPDLLDLDDSSTKAGGIDIDDL